ncbi:hypothetical protein Tco_1143776 [Tanacetum coccineum]
MIVRNDTLLGTLKFVSKTQDYQIYGALIPDEMINQDIKDSKAYKTYLDFATRRATLKKARKFKKVASPLKKLSPVLEEEPAVKPKHAKKPTKKSTTVPTAGVVIKDTPSVDSGSENEASDSEKTDCDEDKNPNLNQNEDVEEEYEEEYVRTPDSYGFTDDDKEYKELYKDVSVRIKDAEHEEEGRGDVEMTDVGRDDGTQRTTYEQVKDDEHVILTTVHDTQKTEVPLQSSSVSSNFAR